MTVALPSPQMVSQPARDWRHDALCLRFDPELFFPVGSSGPAAQQTQHAVAICQACPALACCREFAITVLEHGIAGGLTEAERSAIRFKRSEGRWDQPPEREPNPLDDLSPEALAAALATGPRDAVPEGTPLRVRSELTRSRMFTEFLGSRKSGSPGGVRWSDAGREALSAFRERERRGTRVTEQLGLPIGVSS